VYILYILGVIRHVWFASYVANVKQSNVTEKEL